MSSRTTTTLKCDGCGAEALDAHSWARIFISGTYTSNVGPMSSRPDVIEDYCPKCWRKMRGEVHLHGYGPTA